jgi:hypothetical protein
MARSEITPISRATTATKRAISSLIATKRSEMKKRKRRRRTRQAKQLMHM